MSSDGVLSEEEIIARYFAPLASGSRSALGLKDDCALLQPSTGTELVLKTDPIVAGVHFLPDDDPADIAWKALAVNVSDLAAKGARPLIYLIALGLPAVPQSAWLKGLTRGLREAQDRFGIELAGGDTDRVPGGPLSIAITVIGEVPKGEMVRRGGARAGDILLVSGTIGDSVLGLKARLGELTPANCTLAPTQLAELAARYRRPQPRLELAPVLRRHASAAMDVSDGLIKDADRMARASGVGMRVRLGDVPFSMAARRYAGADRDRLLALLAGGDDYEILAAVPPDHLAEFLAESVAAGCPMTLIGTCEADPARLTLTGDDMQPLPLPAAKGWDHFA
jgi:thiamine-monophosphate kinase